MVHISIAVTGKYPMKIEKRKDFCSLGGNFSEIVKFATPYNN